MPTPRQAADALVALTTTADTYITALRPLLAEIATAEEDLMRAIAATSPGALCDGGAYRRRVKYSALGMLEKDPGKTLTQIIQSAFAAELAQ